MRSRLEIIDTTDNSGPELVSLETVKLELGVEDDDTDDLLNLRITRYSNLIAEQCNRVFAFSFARETFTFDPCECSRHPLGLSIYPTHSIDSVTVDGREVTDYDYDADAGLLSRSGHGVWSGTVVVNYTGGYALPTHAPATLAQAVIETIRDRSLTDDRSATAGIQLISSGEDTVRYFQQSTISTGLSSEVQSMIATFKRPSMA